MFRSSPARLWCICALAAWISMPLRATTAPVYEMVDLGTLGGTGSEALGINDSGVVVGGSLTTGGAAEHAYSYTGGKMTDLGVFSGGLDSEATAINASGQITGWSETSGVDSVGNPVIVGFRYSGGSKSSIGELLGDADSKGFAINSSGNIAGISFTFADTSGTLADENAITYISGKGMTDLGPLAGGFSSEANGINDSGVVAGVSDTGQTDSSGNEIYRAVQYAAGGGIFSIPLLSGQTDSAAFGINDSGTIVGETYTSTGPTYAFSYSNSGGVVNLGLLPNGSVSVATAVNASGQVVGYGDIGAVDAGGNTIYHAFLYTGKKLYDLNSVVANAKGWRLEYALAINDSGQIAGSAINPAGQTHAVMFTSLALAAPIVTTQPVAQTVKAGVNVIFTVAGLSATALSYQWIYNGTTSIPGANGTKLTLSKVTKTNAGFYACVMHNTVGNTTSSDVQLLVVKVVPTITTQPIAINATTGSTVTFSAAAAGDAPMTVVWEKNGVALKTENNYTVANVTAPGLTTTKLTVTKINAANVASYRILATNLAGKATSASVKLTIIK